jgi:hypothetical protein
MPFGERKQRRFQLQDFLVQSLFSKLSLYSSHSLQLFYTTKPSSTFSSEKTRTNIKMRFSTIAAVSAIVLGVNAVANPDVVVYETQVVTITSCPPEKPACPASSTTYIPVTTPAPTTEAPAVTPTETPEVETPETETPEVETPEVETPEAETPEVSTPVETPVTPVTTVAPITTGTGSPSAPGNETTPVVPVTPPTEEFEGAGSKMGVSILAIAGAAVFALLA